MPLIPRLGCVQTSGGWTPRVKVSLGQLGRHDVLRMESALQEQPKPHATARVRLFFLLFLRSLSFARASTHNNHCCCEGCVSSNVITARQGSPWLFTKQPVEKRQKAHATPPRRKYKSEWVIQYPGSQRAMPAMFVALFFRDEDAHFFGWVKERRRGDMHTILRGRGGSNRAGRAQRNQSQPRTYFEDSLESKFCH